MKFLVVVCACLVATAVVQGAPSPNYVSPVILPRIGYAAPDVTVVKQPYVVHQTEPVYRQVYSYAADPLHPSLYPSYHVAYHQQPAATAVYHATPYAHTAVNYVL